MVLLPKGNPVKENVNPGKINLPAALEKLQAGKFCGYLRFDFVEGTGVIIFENGRLISALFEGASQRLIAYDAIASIFEKALEGQGRLNVYRLAPELALSVHALLHGDLLYKGQELKLIDIKALLGRLKEMAMSGCLRIYTGDRVALIFYRDGSPLGFFHDGSTEIETTADTSMSVARLPGAKIDVLTTRGGGEGMLADLMKSADVAALWNKAQGELARRSRNVEEETSRARGAREKERRQNLLAMMKTVSSQHLGKIGGSLVEKEFEKNLSDTLDEASLMVFYDRLSKAAKLVAGASKINSMLDEMKKGAKAVLGEG
ncbi:GTPase-activating protein [Trichloromonas sp.]|uniref:GTPase-activating protein n=1 Tax=Trichloromonas sp. TaxID=3069249 RepID=UPI003D818A30